MRTNSSENQLRALDQPSVLPRIASSASSSVLGAVEHGEAGTGTDRCDKVQICEQSTAYEGQVLSFGDVGKWYVRPVARQVGRVGRELVVGEVDEGLRAGGVGATNGTSANEGDDCRPTR